MLAFMIPSTVQSERRKIDRKRPPSLVYVELASANGGMMRDVSEEGFSVRAMMPLKSGAKTLFSFSLSGSERVEGEGEILWVEENGHVAGVQFTQIPSTSQALLRDWLTRPADAPERESAESKPKTEAAVTFEQLREQMQTVPARETGREEAEEAPIENTPEPVARPPEAPASSPPVETMAPVASSLEPVEMAAAPVEELPEPGTMSGSRRLIPPRVDSAIADARVASPADHPSPAVDEGAMPAAFPEIFENQDGQSEPVPVLPDISTILMQPAGAESDSAARTYDHRALQAIDHAPAVPSATWQSRFTLTTAVAIMSSLALMLAIYVYHREVGQGLIWLGERMGGTETSDGAAPTSSQSGSADNASGGTARQEGENETAAAGKSATVDPSHAAQPPATKGQLPAPVTPLADLAAGSNGFSQETGQTEYLQAMNLLRSKPSGADLAEAVRLLWICVEKGSPSAEVVLADMYWHGQGVAKNCDQARILLTAAARKGSADGKKRLQQFQREGCE
jgi:hypothetical protein